MGILKFLGFKKAIKPEVPVPDNDTLYLWEDDYLMLELLPEENLEFIKKETARINNFAEEHFEGNGFTGITVVSEKPVKTIEKLIDFHEIEKIILNSGLEKVSKIHFQFAGILNGENAPAGFGTKTFAIMLEKEGRFLKNISLEGRTMTENEMKMLANALLAIGQEYKFIAVNWFQCGYYYLTERESVEEFIKNSC